jgi:cell division transport system permease protein
MAVQFGKSYIKKKAKPSYIYAIVGITIILFLLGLLGLVVIHANKLSVFFKENIEVTVILRDNVRESSALKMKEIIDKQAFTKSSDYVSKTAAADKFKQEFGEDFIDILDGVNPLFASVNVHLNSNYVREDSLIKIEAFLKQSNIVREVFYQKMLVDMVTKNARRIGFVILAICIIFSLIVIVLIDNTIRLAMYSNRFLVKTMQMVGATRWFIAKPFNVQSIINGIISGFCAIVLLVITLWYAQAQVPELKGMQDNNALITLCIGILLVGVFISLISTHRSVIKYLKMQLDDLY